MSEIWARIAQQVSGGSRTDALRGLVWPNALLLTALIWASVKEVNGAVLILLSFLLIMFMLLYAAAFIYFGVKDPNLLRSEKYNIEKMAIERGVYGDSITGVTDTSTKPIVTLQGVAEDREGSLQ